MNRGFPWRENIDTLADIPLEMILYKIGPKGAARLSCVSKELKSLAANECFWENVCLRDFEVSALEDHHGNPTASFKETYGLWHEALCMYPFSLIKRVKRCWTVIKNWMELTFPEAVGTLRTGASEAQIKEVEDALEVELPSPTKLLYRFYDGQDIQDSKPSPLGLIGGYTFSNHGVNVYLSPLKEILMETRKYFPYLGSPNAYKYLLVAQSDGMEKCFFLNCTNGHLYVGTANVHTQGEMCPCVAQRLIPSMLEMNVDDQTDGMLLWLEEHGRRLQSGVIGVSREGGIRSISLFPKLPPLCHTSVKNGVEIHVSTCFMPELTDLRNHQLQYCFAYLISACLLSEGFDRDGIDFSSCKIKEGVWHICENEATLLEIKHKEIEMYATLLDADGDEPVYKDFLIVPSYQCSMEGHFVCVLGSVEVPEGGEFKVEVAPFPMVSDYIF